MKNNDDRLSISLDPDPITTAAFIIAAVSAATGVADLLIKTREVRLKTESQRKKFTGILKKANDIGKRMDDDIDEFREQWIPTVVRDNDQIPVAIWDLRYHKYQTMKRILRRVLSSHNDLQDLHNLVGEMDLEELGDAWRFHSLEESTSLFHILSSIRTTEDFLELSNEIDNRLQEYIRSIDDLREKFDS